MVSCLSNETHICPPNAVHSSCSIVPYTVDPQGVVFFCLGREAITADNWCEQLKWTTFGGSCKASDQDSAETAAREFFEESMGVRVLEADTTPTAIRTQLLEHAPMTIHMVDERKRHPHIHTYYFVRTFDGSVPAAIVSRFSERRARLVQVRSAADRHRMVRSILDQRLGSDYRSIGVTPGPAPMARAIRNGREVTCRLPTGVDPSVVRNQFVEYNQFVSAMEMDQDPSVEFHHLAYTDASGEAARFVADVRVPVDVLELQEMRFFSEHELAYTIEGHGFAARRSFRQRFINLARFVLPLLRRRRAMGGAAEKSFG